MHPKELESARTDLMPQPLPKISVCMATHNGGRYLHQQLASILSQLGTDDELIISDDSSRDDTVSIIKGYDDPRIRLYENNRFFSPIFNFEFALQQAVGDIVLLSDQDDVWLPGKVDTIHRRFTSNPDRPLLIVLDGVIIDETGNQLYGSIFKKIKSGSGIVKNLYDNTYLGCCLAFSRDLLNIALPFPKTIPMHDMWLGLLCDIHGAVEFDETKTLQYRKHAASLTDFKRTFQPLLQIRRRWCLGFHLLARSVACVGKKNTKVTS